MPIEVQCDNCGQHYKAPESWRGQTKKCPKCGAAFLVSTREGDLIELPLEHFETPAANATPDDRDTGLGSDLDPLSDLDDFGGAAGVDDPLGALDDDDVSAGSNLLRPPPKSRVDWKSYLEKVPWPIVIRVGAAAGALLIIVGIAWFVVGRFRSIGGPSDVVGSEPLVWNVEISPVKPRQMTVADYAIDASSSSVWVPPRHRRFCIITHRQRSGTTHQIWNLSTGEFVRTVDDSPQTKEFLNIDREGKILVTYGRHDGREAVAVIPFDADYTPVRFEGELLQGGFFEFLPKDQMVAVVNTSLNQLGIFVYDLRAGKKLREFATPGTRPDEFDVSPNGRYLAAMRDDRIVLFDLKSGEVAGELEKPASNSLIPHRVNCQILRFSHDGRELAAKCEDEGSCRIVCWDTATGKGLRDYVVRRWYGSAGNDGFEWMPDDSGWFCFGRQYVARDNGLTVWGGTFADFDGKGLGPLNDRRMLVHWERGGDIVEPVPYPRQEMTARREALADDGAAWVKPGQGVSLKIDVGSVRFGSQNDAERYLRDALTERLAHLGVPVESGQPAVLEIAYSETKGETLGEVENGGLPMPMPNDRPTGKKITGTKALITIQWKIPRQAKPVWQTRMEVDPSWVTLYRGTDEAASERTREDVRHQVSQLAIPYFVPKSSGEPAILPFVTTYERQHEAPTVAHTPSAAPSSGTTGSTTEEATTPSTHGDTAQTTDPDGAAPPRIPPPRVPPIPSRAALPEGPSLIEWNVSADPPRLPQEFREGKISVDMPSFSDFKFSVIPSTLLFVHSTRRGGEGVGILDLATGEEKAVIEGEFDLDEPYDFSPTGLYLAAPEGRNDTKINVWSFDTGQLVRQLDLGKGPRLESLHFVGPRHLLLLRSDFDGAELILWDVEQDTPQRRIHVVGTDSRQRFRRKSLASTPGGKYVALIMGELLSVYDLTNGKCVGQLALPEEFWMCYGVSFSPDGSQVAALVGTETEAKLWVWDVADGDLVAEYPYDIDTIRRLQNYPGPMVEWFPNGQGWLFGGHLLVDGQSGQPFWDLPSTTHDPRKMLAHDRLLAMMNAGRGSAIIDVKLPAKDVEKALATVRAGGEIVDALLPELTTANWFGATPVGLPSGVVEWNVSPEPTPASEAVGRPITIGSEYHVVKAVRFAGPGSKKVVVHKEIRPPSKAGRRPPPQYVIERYDIGTAAKGNELPLPQPYRLLDVAPSGDRALVGLYLNRKQERIDVLSLSPKKHIAGWRPYGEKTDPHIVQACFVDDETVLTVSGEKTLAAWKMPDCGAKYSVKEFGWILALSPRRNLVFGEQDTIYRIFDAATGECRGELERPQLAAPANCGAFHPDGARLAGLVRDRYAQSIVIWNLRDGKILSEFAISTEVGDSYERRGQRNPWVMDWRGSDYLLLDGRYLVDVEREALVWQYHPSGIHAENTPDGRHWCSGTRPLRDKSAQFLAAMPMPSPLVVQKADGVRREDQIVLGPGGQVAVTAHVGSVPGYPDLRQTVLDSLNTSLQLRGIKVDPSAKVRLTLKTARRTTGETLAVNEGFGGHSSPDRTFAQQTMVCTITLTDDARKVAWQRDRNIPMRSFGTVDEPDARRQLETEMQQSFGEFVSGDVAGSLGLPMYVFRPLDEIIAGETKISIHGESAAPKKPAGH